MFLNVSVDQFHELQSSTIYMVWTCIMYYWGPEREFFVHVVCYVICPSVPSDGTIRGGIIVMHSAWLASVYVGEDVPTICKWQTAI